MEIFLMLSNAPGFTARPEQLALATALSRITFPYLIMTVVAVQLSAMLNAIDKFWASAAWSNFLNLTMIAALLAAPWFPNAAYAAAWGVLAGGVVQLVFIVWAAARDGLRLRFHRPRWTPEIKEFFMAFGAVTFGAASITIAPFIDIIIASLLPSGSLTALYYADRINQLPLGVLGIALGTVLLPEMSTRLAKGDVVGSDAAQNRAAALTLLLTLPFVAVFLLIPDTIMRAIFAHGAFNQKPQRFRPWRWRPTASGCRRWCWCGSSQSTFYARHDTATPARATVTCHRLQYRHQAGAGAGLRYGHCGHRAGHGHRRLGECRDADLVQQTRRLPEHPAGLAPRSRADAAGGAGRRGRGLCGA